MNVHDSENIKGIMEDLGYNEEENYEKDSNHFYNVVGSVITVQLL